MPLIAESKFKDLRAYVRGEIAAIKEKTIKVCVDKTSLRPVMLEQQKLGLNVVNEIYQKLRIRHQIDESKLIGFISGSYARGTCVYGADFDLNMVYPEGSRKHIYPFERELRGKLAYVYGMLPDDIHNSVVSRAGDRFYKDITLKEFGGRLFFGRYLTKLVRPRFEKYFARLLDSTSPIELYFMQKLCTFSFLLAIKYSNREPDITEDYLIKNITEVIKGAQYIDAYFNNKYIFGNRDSFDNYENKIYEAEKSVENETKEKNGDQYEIDNMIDFSRRSLSALENGPIEIPKRSIYKKVLKQYGSDVAYNLLSFLMRGNALSLRTLDGYYNSEKIRAIFGRDFHVFFDGVDDILKIKALLRASCTREEYYYEISSGIYDEISKNMGCLNQAELFDLIRFRLKSLHEIMINALEKVKSSD